MKAMAEADPNFGKFISQSLFLYIQALLSKSVENSYVPLVLYKTRY